MARFPRIRFLKQGSAALGVLLTSACWAGEGEPHAPDARGPGSANAERPRNTLSFDLLEFGLFRLDAIYYHWAPSAVLLPLDYERRLSDLLALSAIVEIIPPFVVRLNVGARVYPLWNKPVSGLWLGAGTGVTLGFGVSSSSNVIAAFNLALSLGYDFVWRSVVISPRLRVIVDGLGGDRPPIALLHSAPLLWPGLAIGVSF